MAKPVTLTTNVVPKEGAASTFEDSRYSDTSTQLNVSVVITDTAGISGDGPGLQVGGVAPVLALVPNQGALATGALQEIVGYQTANGELRFQNSGGVPGTPAPTAAGSWLGNVGFQGVNGNFWNYGAQFWAVAFNGFAKDNSVTAGWDTCGINDGGTVNRILIDQLGNTHVKNGLLVLDNLPTADPAVKGAVWNSNGTLMVSAG